MSDFTSEDLFDAADRAVHALIERAAIAEPPVDALELLAGQFQYRIDFELDDDGQDYGSRPRRRARPNELLLHPDSSEESRHALAARAIARKLVPDVLKRLGITPGTESRAAQGSLIGLLSSRLLLPTRFFAADARRAAFDLIELKDRYSTAGWEAIAWRMLEVDDEPAMVAIVDDGEVAARRGNRFAVNRTLTEAERRCVESIQETDDPATIRADGWTARGWPTRGIPFRRIIVRSMPDEV